MARHSLLHRRQHDADPTGPDAGRDAGRENDTARSAGEGRHEGRYDPRNDRPGDGTDRPHHTDHTDHTDHTGDVRERHAAALHDTYGGINWGACFFGWLVAVGVGVLLTAVVSAIAAAAGANLDLSGTQAQDAAESNAGTVGLAAAATLAVIMLIAYYAGGYVAGRMSRFDGARQGLGVWLVGLLAIVVVAVVAAVFGARYDVLDQLDLPSVPLSGDQLGWGAIVAGVVWLAVMLIGALLGGAMGRRYHHKIDRDAGVLR